MKRFARTREAIRNFEVAEAKFMRSASLGDDAILNAMREEHQALIQVGEAYYQDTKDLNRIEDCVAAVQAPDTRGKIWQLALEERNRTS